MTATVRPSVESIKVNFSRPRSNPAVRYSEPRPSHAEARPRPEPGYRGPRPDGRPERPTREAHPQRLLREVRPGPSDRFTRGPRGEANRGPSDPRAHRGPPIEIKRGLSDPQAQRPRPPAEMNRGPSGDPRAQRQRPRIEGSRGPSDPNARRHGDLRPGPRRAAKPHEVAVRQDVAGARSPFASELPVDVQGSPFTLLGVAPALARAVLEAGYQTPTPIQAQTIPLVLSGRDVLGCAQTGTGKTAAFMLPLLQLLVGRTKGAKPRCLILSPTRELAAQIGRSAATYGRYLDLGHTVIYGGVSQRGQEREIERNPDVVVATPGRLLDLWRQGWLDLSGIEILVLDEADTMLDMGFIHDVRRIVAEIPRKRQTLLFSATMPRAIRELASNILTNPESVSVTPQGTSAETVEQAVYFVAKPDKHKLLRQLLEAAPIDRALVFTRTKHGADRVARGLVQSGVEAGSIHGNKSQNARDRVLRSFKQGSITVLVATDVAARGLDVQGISHVFNYDLPNVAESYVHRIGRTGRAGAPGRAISFCDRDERKLLSEIERLIRRRISVVEQTERQAPVTPGS